MSAVFCVSSMELGQQALPLNDGRHGDPSIPCDVLPSNQALRIRSGLCRSGVEGEAAKQSWFGLAPEFGRPG